VIPEKPGEKGYSVEVVAGKVGARGVPDYGRTIFLVDEVADISGRRTGGNFTDGMFEFTQD
jgi:hypothetical protein